MSGQGDSDDVTLEADLVPRVKRKSVLRWAVEIALSMGVVVAIFILLLPRITGSTYAQVWDVLGSLGPWHLLLLTVVWLVNMALYTGVLTNSLPGLTHPQAFVANLSSSAVSNVLPFGGAAGVAATYLMYGSWGFTASETTRSILVSGVWNVLAKLALPVVALVLLSFTHQATVAVASIAALGIAVLVASILLFWAVLRSDAFADAVGRLADRVLSACTRLVRRPPVTGIEQRLMAFRHESRALIADRWVPLTVWIVLYNASQFVLLLLCLDVLPAAPNSLGWVEVFAAFTVGRLLSNVSVTPSGLGFVEAGIAASLVAAGGDPVRVTAAVLLFSAFTYLAEIPVGAIGWLVWATRARWRRPVGSRHTSASPSPAAKPG